MIREHLLIGAVLIAPIAAEAIRRACARSQYPLKALAADMGITPVQLSQELSGMGHLALDRLEHAGPAFRAALLEELASAWGVTAFLVTPSQVLDTLQRLAERGGRA